MARNDIRFGQAQQADFSGANQMFGVAVDLTNQAFKHGKNAIDNYTKAVTDHNDAVIKGFINSIPKEEWETRQGDIQAFIQDIADKSGNMYNAGAIETYRDERMNTLLTRDNTQMLNQEKELAHQDKLDTYQAQELVNMASMSDRANEVTQALSNASPSVVAKFNELSTQSSLDRLNNEAKLNNATAEHNASTVASSKGYIDNLTNDMALAHTEAQNATTPEQKKQALDRLASLNKTFSEFANKNSRGTDYMISALNKAMPQASKTVQDRLKAQAALLKAQSDYEIALGNLKVSQQNANTNTMNAETNARAKATELALEEQKLIQEATQTKTKNLSEVEKKTRDAGYPLASELNKVSPNAIRNIYHSRVERAVNEEKLKLDGLNYNDWVQKNKSKLGEYVTDTEFLSRYSRFEHLNNAFAKYSKSKGGRILTDFEKIFMMSLLSGNGYGLNDFSTYADNPIDYINRHLPTAVAQYNRLLTEAGKKQGNDDIAMLRQSYNLSPNQLGALLADGGGIGDLSKSLIGGVKQGYSDRVKSNSK